MADSDLDELLSELRPESAALVREAEAKAEQYPADQVVTVPADGDYDHRLAKESLFGAIVCTRKTAQEAAAWLTEVRPPGTKHGKWEPAEPPDEIPCPDRPETHRHVVVNC